MQERAELEQQRALEEEAARREAAQRRDRETAHEAARQAARHRLRCRWCAHVGVFPLPLMSCPCRFGAVFVFSPMTVGAAAIFVERASCSSQRSPSVSRLVFSHRWQAAVRETRQ